MKNQLDDLITAGYGYLHNYLYGSDNNTQSDDGSTLEFVGWIARDKDGDLGLFEYQPDRLEDSGIWGGLRNMILRKESFPDVTWEEGAVAVCIKISL